MTRILLVGAMGSGKTSVGKALAVKTGWPYADNDSLLVRSTGQTAKALLERDGEQGLHAAEANVLTLQLGLPAPVILGISGGAVLTASTRERLRTAGHVVWLKATPAVIARRVGNGAGRPLVGQPGQPSDTAAILARLAAERDAFYAEIAGQVVDVDVVTPAAAAIAVLDALGPVTTPG